MNLFIPFILIIISIGTFFTFIDPQYQEIKILLENKNQFIDLRKQGNEIDKKRTSLRIKFSENVSAKDLSRLEKLLPNHMDNVELIVDIDRIAKEQAIRITDIQLIRNVVNKNNNNNVEVIDIDSKKYNSVNLSFSFVTKYGNFKYFMDNLRKSLRLIDVVSVSFSKEVGDKFAAVDNFKFNVEVRAYWLKR